MFGGAAVLEGFFSGSGLDGEFSGLAGFAGVLLDFISAMERPCFWGI
jgi:hypothetical protein